MEEIALDVSIRANWLVGEWRRIEEEMSCLTHQIARIPDRECLDFPGILPLKMKTGRLRHIAASKVSCIAPERSSLPLREAHREAALQSRDPANFPSRREIPHDQVARHPAEHRNLIDIGADKAVARIVVRVTVI